jgi:hypothetical protein
MKKLLYVLILLVCSSSVIWAQKALPRGINYQAIMRDAAGKLMIKQPVALRFSFSKSESDPQVFYTEVHQVTTDDLGLVNLVIGEGKVLSGDFDKIPWSQGSMWFGVEADVQGNQDFNVLGRSPLLSAPYAFHANTTNAVAESPNAANDVDQKNQSIYWVTGGNTATRPENHFTGTRDNQNFVLKTNLRTRAVFTKEGQLQIKSGVDGPDNSRDAYPVVVEGSKQGIWITINGTRSESNNFVTFADAENTWGAIEGQTLAELQNSSEYKNQVALFELALVSTIAQGVSFAITAAGYVVAAIAAGASIVFSWQAPGWILAGVGVIAEGVGVATEIASLIIAYDDWVENTVNAVGVSYSSGAGDYAEWLPRATKERDLLFGEIVGVKGGTVSLNTSTADHFMVVSTRPAVLGNAPQVKDQAAFEKIAFMGQVPVKVLGKVEVGDYIIPSGNNDGMGVAVNPKKLAAADFAKIVGVAWEATKDDAPVLHYVKVAVGIKKNDLAPKVEELSNKVDNIMAYLEGKGPLRPETATAGTAMTGSTTMPAAAQVTTVPDMAKLMSDQEYDLMLDQNADQIGQIFQETIKELERRNFDLNKRPEIKEFLNNPIPRLKALRRNPALASHWGQIDASFLQNRK